MMKWVFSVLMIISIIFGISSGNIEAVSNAAISSGKETVNLVLILMGSMAVWGGIMKIAEKSGLTDKIAFLFRPVAKLLFKGIDPHGKAFKAITMNITANMLGLGNAATPLGIEAMKQLEKEEHTTTVASRNMIMFTVINTASITLIPTTVATLRLEAGSKTPLDILPAVLIVSALCLTVGITNVFLLDKKSKGADNN